MWLAYALVGTLAIGGADFSIVLAGRVLARPREIFGVSWLQHLVSLVVLAGVVWAFDTGTARRADFLWGAAAGVALGAAKPLLFAGLSFARISVFAPVAAVASIVVPVTYALARGERPGAVALLGIGLALPAVVLLGYDRHTHAGLWSPARVLTTAATSEGYCRHWLAIHASGVPSSRIVGELFGENRPTRQISPQGAPAQRRAAAVHCKNYKHHRGSVEFLTSAARGRETAGSR